MPYWFSIVILASNNARTLPAVLKAVEGISDDIVILVNNSKDDTEKIARNFGCCCVVVEWQGYGATKNIGNNMAKYPWILSLDADEEIDARLRQSLQNAKQPAKVNTVFNVCLKLNWENKILHYGSSKEIKRRFFNRENALWNANLVHEELVFKDHPLFELLAGTVIHHSYPNKEAAYAKMSRYALFAAQQRTVLKKAPSKFKLIFAHHWRYFLSYYVLLGFLDGKKGKEFATLEQFYTKEKYRLWYELSKT
jgi:glycosyltransferase involved in cell wall biosynthesis